MGCAICRGTVVQQHLMCLSGSLQPPFFLGDPKMGRGEKKKLMTGDAQLLIKSRDAHPPYKAG